MQTWLIHIIEFQDKALRQEQDRCKQLVDENARLTTHNTDVQVEKEELLNERDDLQKETIGLNSQVLES